MGVGRHLSLVHATTWQKREERLALLLSHRQGHLTCISDWIYCAAQVRCMPVVRVGAIFPKGRGELSPEEGRTSSPATVCSEERGQPSQGQ